jgi:hypothetical protein
MLKVKLVSNKRSHSADGGATAYVDRELKPISAGKSEQHAVRAGVQWFEGYVDSSSVAGDRCCSTVVQRTVDERGEEP